MLIRNFFDRLERKRQVLRGDAVIVSDQALTALGDLSEHLFPESWLELSNDLFGLLGFTVLAEQGSGLIDAADFLKAVHEKATLGATDTVALINQINSTFPDAKHLIYLTDYLKEIQEKNAQDLLWPVIGRIEQHQAPSTTFNVLINFSDRLMGNADLKAFTAHTFGAITPPQPLVEQTWLLIGLAVSWNLPHGIPLPLRDIVARIAATCAQVAEDPRLLPAIFGTDPHQNAELARAAATEITKNQATYLYRLTGYLAKNIAGGRHRHFAKAITVKNIPGKK